MNYLALFRKRVEWFPVDSTVLNWKFSTAQSYTFQFTLIFNPWLSGDKMNICLSKVHLYERLARNLNSDHQIHFRADIYNTSSRISTNANRFFPCFFFLFLFVLFWFLLLFVCFGFFFFFFFCRLFHSGIWILFGMMQKSFCTNKSLNKFENLQK